MKGAGMNKDTIGNRLKTVREEHELSQRELAAEMGVSNSSISRIEKDESLPGTKTLIAYMDYFCISADWILGRGANE